MDAKRVARFGLLTAMMLVLGLAERSLLAFIPLPMGVKLGLANSVLVFALYMMGVKSALALMVLKVGLSALLFAGVSTVPYSAAGGVLSLAAMLAARKLPGVGVVGVSAAGAVFHNVGQVLMAMWIVQTPMLAIYLVILLGSGIGTGVAMGLVAQLVMKHLGDRVR
ncbi:MAG: Gx transporter family protein [Clostridiales bacterium]|nr:Gx transporter family protein [Clostridiales bacterium]